MAEKNTYLQDVCRIMATEWPGNRTINIVCHGHSVPAGYFLTPLVDTFNSYPHVMHLGLKERYPLAVINVIVTAIGSENSEEGAERFERDVLSLRPDVVTIDYALNDRPIGVGRARAAWIRMIRAAAAKNVKLILMTPTGDWDANLDDPNDPLNQQAEQVRRLAAEFDVGLADSLAAFKRRIAQGVRLTDLLSQVNHPNRAGHDLVAAELLQWFPAP